MMIVLTVGQCISIMDLKGGTHMSEEKKDIMKVIDEIMNILDQVDVKSPELSDLQNKLNKVKCNG